MVRPRATLPAGALPLASRRVDARRARAVEVVVLPGSAVLHGQRGLACACRPRRSRRRAAARAGGMLVSVPMRVPMRVRVCVVVAVGVAVAVAVAAQDLHQDQVEEDAGCGRAGAHREAAHGEGRPGWRGGVMDRGPVSEATAMQ